MEFQAGFLGDGDGAKTPSDAFRGKCLDETFANADLFLVCAPRVSEKLVSEFFPRGGVLSYHPCDTVYRRTTKIVSL